MCETSSIDLQTFYPDSLKITKVTEDETQITISLKSLTHSHLCPSCGEEMTSYHGSYIRTVQDLPILMKTVTLKITAYEYYCTNESCTAITFSEDYEGFVGRSERLTSRLEEFIRALAFETSCEGAAVICKELGILISGDSIIRMLRKLSCNISTEPSGDTIGVDDFAYRKGQTYCTVICNGKTHKPIEILNGRDGTELKEWLRKNKQVKKVTRDRAGAYAKAIADELPEAMQIADRFHLHQNLLTAVKEALKIDLPNRIAVPNEIIASEMGESACTPEVDKKNGRNQSLKG